MGCLLLIVGLVLLFGAEDGTLRLVGPILLLAGFFGDWDEKKCQCRRGGG